MILEKSRTNKNVPKQKNFLETVRKSSLLFALKSSCMENFRCDRKYTQFVLVLFLNFKKSPKHSHSKTKIVEQIETFRSDIKNSTERRSDRQDNMQTERQDDRQTDNLD